MHFSLVKTALAVLSLGTIFLGANSAPSTSSGELSLRAPRKPVPDLKEHDYTLTDKKIPTGDMGNLWDVEKDDKLIARLGVDKDGHLMAVGEAYNEEKKLTKGDLDLRAIILSTWEKVSKKEVKDLKKIAYKTIQNDAAKKSMLRAFDMIDGESKKETVKPTQKEPFHELMTSNPFGVGVQKMLAEFKGMEGRKVTEISITRQFSWEMTFVLSAGD
jgi:hypothetical protein